MPTIHNIFTVIPELLADHVSVIPVYDAKHKNEAKRKKPCTFLDKDPLSEKFGKWWIGWDKYKSQLIDQQEIWDTLQYHGSDSFACVCGAISGNLEMAEIDIKNYPGIDAQIFTGLRQLYPQIFSKIRIHQSPSGGYHFIYRCTEKIEGNKKMASRIVDGKKLAFLETRGEGGYFLYPPSAGYKVIQDNPIPVFTWEERASLLAFLKSFNEVVVEVKDRIPYKDDFYSTNPFEDFNQSERGAKILSEFGWKEINTHAGRTYYTRPGKDSGVSASFMSDNRFIYIFTSSTELENEKRYKPSTILRLLKFGGDGKKTFAYLKDAGYGKIRPEKEAEIIRNPLRKLPNNISEEAKAQHERSKTEFEIKYPYGVFWQENEGVYSINAEAIYRVMGGLGIRSYRDRLSATTRRLYQINGCFLTELDEDTLLQVLRQYVKEEDLEMADLIHNTLNDFIRIRIKYMYNHFSGMADWYIHDREIFKSEKTISRLFYKNVWLEIDSKGYDIKQYPCPGYIMSDKVLQRNFTDGNEHGIYREFVVNALGKITPYILQCIGFYAHDYRDEESYVCICVEEGVIGGGSGKNLFAKLLGGITSFWEIAGDLVTEAKGEAIFQSWSGERVAAFQDLPRNFKPEKYRETINGTSKLKILYKNVSGISLQDMPKLIWTTNYSWDNNVPGMARRGRPLVFTDFYTRMGGVKKVHGKMFPSGWNEVDWQSYDNFMVGAIQIFLANDCVIDEGKLTAGAWVKQFAENYPNMSEFIEGEISGWVNIGHVSIATYNDKYKWFAQENGIRSPLTPNRKNAALTAYCEHNNIQVERKQLNGSLCWVFNDKSKDDGIPF